MGGMLVSTWSDKVEDIGRVGGVFQYGMYRRYEEVMKRFHSLRWALLGVSCRGHRVLCEDSGVLVPSSMWSSMEFGFCGSVRSARVFTWR